MKAEWLPVNPCPCGAIRYPDGHKCNAEDDLCHVYTRYQGKVEMARELLEYLRSEYQEDESDWVSISTETIKSMLKQLEGKNV
jgi:hypothetical protein